MVRSIEELEAAKKKLLEEKRRQKLAEEVRQLTREVKPTKLQRLDKAGNKLLKLWEKL